MGNICRIDENGEPVVWYKYDALNRLVREDNKTFKKTWLYRYDNKGNILCKRETAFNRKHKRKINQIIVKALVLWPKMCYNIIAIYNGKEKEGPIE